MNIPGEQSIKSFLLDLKINNFKSIDSLFEFYNQDDILKAWPFYKFKKAFTSMNKKENLFYYSPRKKKWFRSEELPIEKKVKDYPSKEDKCDCGECCHEEEQFSLGMEFERLLKSFIREFVVNLSKKELSELLKPIVKEELKNAYPDIMKGIKKYIEDKYSLETEQTLEQKVRTILKNAF